MGDVGGGDKVNAVMGGGGGACVLVEMLVRGVTAGPCGYPRALGRRPVQFTILSQISPQ